jgi:hypothetical protein
MAVSFTAFEQMVSSSFSMIQLTKRGIIGETDYASFEDQFEHVHAFRLPGLVHPELTEVILRLLEKTEWFPRDTKKVGRELLPSTIQPSEILNFALNTPEFLALIRRITRNPEITWFGGRVYRMAPDADHSFDWHDDLGLSGLLVGMSINLSPRPYEGGVFKLRDESSRRVLCEWSNTDLGSAVLFRISDKLKHMVTRVEGNEPKTAFAGWFRSGEFDNYSSLRPDQTLD